VTPSGRVVLRDPAGVEVLSYRAVDELSDGANRPLAADVRLAGGDPDHAADVVLAQLQGWAVAAPGDLAAALAARGAVVRRRMRIMTRSLRADPPPPEWARSPLGPGVDAVPPDRSAAEVFPAWRAAYATGSHPDAYPGDDAGALAERLVPLLTGAWGDVLPWSLLAVDARDDVVAGVYVLAAQPPVDMPWIGDVFRRPGPEHAGIGAALLQRVLALAVARDVEAVGLSVTDGIPAGAVYERLGFTTRSAHTTVLVP